MNLLLPVLLVFPLVGALVMYPLRGTPDVAKKVAMATALLEIVLAAVTWAAYSVPAAVAGTRFQLEFAVEWIPAFGTRFALGIDGIALVMIALTAFLVPGLMLFSWEERLPEGRTASGYFALLLATEATLMGVFTATDVFLFYVFFEVMLIPMYFLIGRFGGPRRQYAAVKFFLYSLFGGLIMLASLIGLYVVSADLRPAGGTFDWATLRTIVPLIPESTQIWLFLGFFVAFAIKAPLVPLHTWLPDAGAEAPIGAGVLLVGVLDKVGTFGFLRYCLPLFPLASQRLAPLVLILSVVGIIYGALLAVGQKDMSRFVAYTSIAHFGFIALGIFAFSTQSFAGAVLYMVNHGLSTGMLFVMVGLLAARGGSRMISDYGGVAKIAPVLAGCFLLAGLSSLALPGTNSFVSEFLVLLGSFPREPVYTIIATVGIIFAALYVLWVYQQTMQGPVRGDAVLAALGRTDSTEEEPPPVGVGFPGARRAEGSDRSGHDASDPDSDRSDHDASDPHSVRAGRPRPDQGARAGRPAGGPGAMIDPAIAARRAGSGFPDLSVREVTVLVPLIVAILLLGFFPGPVLDVINPSVAATMSEVGLTDPVGGTSR